MRRALWALGALALAGCGDFGQADDGVPGDSLGTFAVEATQEQNTCGPGALGSSEIWRFEVRLSRHFDELYWLHGGEAIEGRIAPDGISFAFDTHVRVPLQESQNGRPGCTVIRNDQATGQLDSPHENVEGFSGRLRYGFEATADSSCLALEGSEGGFATLPCEMSYRLRATRSQPPE